MVLEKVEITISEGREEDFLRYLQSTRHILENSPGCRSVAFGRGVENPGKMVLLVGWDSIAAHEAAKAPDSYKEFSKGLAPFVNGATMEHFVIGD